MCAVCITISYGVCTAPVCQRWHFFWHVILTCDFVQIDLSKIYQSLEGSPALRWLTLLQGFLFSLLVFTSYMLDWWCNGNNDHYTAVFRPSDTILIAAGGNRLAPNIQINKPLFLACADYLYLLMFCFCLLLNIRANCYRGYRIGGKPYISPCFSWLLNSIFPLILIVVQSLSFVEKE